MNTHQSMVLQTLKEIQRFLDERGAELAGLAQTGARKKLDQTVAELTQYAVIQSGSGFAAKSSTRRVRVLTTDLLDHHMAPIARIASAELPPVPELAPLGMPKGRETGERLVALARGMAAEARKFIPTFTDAGLPADFIEKLEQAAEAVAESVTNRKQHQGDRGAATKLLRKGLADASRVVNVLDSFVKTAGKGNPSLLAAWKIVKRHRRASVQSKVAPVSEPAPAAGGAS